MINWFSKICEGGINNENSATNAKIKPAIPEKNMQLFNNFDLNKYTLLSYDNFIYAKK